MEVTVVCTGRGSHKRHTFNEFLLAEDGSFTMRQHRVGNEPDWKDLTDDDGATLLHTPILPPHHQPRTSKDGWRWQCPYCPSRVRFSTDELAAWLRGKRVADISVAPK